MPTRQKPSALRIVIPPAQSTAQGYPATIFGPVDIAALNEASKRVARHPAHIIADRLNKAATEYFLKARIFKAAPPHKQARWAEKVTIKARELLRVLGCGTNPRLPILLPINAKVALARKSGLESPEESDHRRLLGLSEDLLHSFDIAANGIWYIYNASTLTAINNRKRVSVTKSGHQDDWPLSDLLDRLSEIYIENIGGTVPRSPKDHSPFVRFTHQVFQIIAKRMVDPNGPKAIHATHYDIHEKRMIPGPHLEISAPFDGSDFESALELGAKTSGAIAKHMGRHSIPRIPINPRGDPNQRRL